MSTPNPTHIIAEHVCSYYGPPNGSAISYCWCGWAGVDHAAHVVSKLTDAGYSIVPTVAEPVQQLLVMFDYRSDGGPKRVGIFSSRLDAEAYVKSLGEIDEEWCVASVTAAAEGEKP